MTLPASSSLKENLAAAFGRAAAEEWIASLPRLLAGAAALGTSGWARPWTGSPTITSVPPADPPRTAAKAKSS
ncbi:MAG: hypothetical protein M5U11_05070 [Anaerolineales bacterium]|nr:hypothetical protein [Anaerolineales bacterium]